MPFQSLVLSVLLGLEEAGDTGTVGFHGLLTRLPADGAHLAVLVRVLEGLHQAEGLVHVAADGKVVDGHLANDAVPVDDEQSSVGDAFILLKDEINNFLVKKQQHPWREKNSMVCF